jgi:hypothetical protein
MRGTSMASLAEFRRSIYSQNGEDGVIAEIFRRLPAAVHRWYAEFGAWDGRYGSNCYALALAGWEGVMIEGDPHRFKRLERTARRFSGRMVALCAFVESGSHLEQLLASAHVPVDYGLLSIDIDSFDYEIWKGMSEFRPAVVVIEIDSSTPPGVRHVWDGEEYAATTFTSMVELGVSKGYTPVCHTGNLIFVRDDLVEHLGELPAESDDLFIRDWIDPTRVQVWRRKLRWLTPQRALCKAEEIFAKLRPVG